MQKGLVSVIIPAYNARQYIDAAVESALHQTYPVVEIIVVDDGSTDGTGDIVKPYRDAGKIIYIRQENKGLAAARNTGIRAARGEYIALLDADDIFLPQKLEHQIVHLNQNPSCDLCYCDLWHFYEEEPDRLMKLNYQYYSGDDVLPHLLWRNFINPLTIVARQSVFGRYGYFNEAMRRSEDWDCWMRAAYGGARFCFLSEILAKYRMQRESLSYDWSSEVWRKATTLDIFLRLRRGMPQKDRRRHHINIVIAYHWLKLQYAKLDKHLKFLKNLHKWLQQRRLKRN